MHHTIGFSDEKSKQHGVTSAISLAYPTARDTQLSTQLEESLKSLDMYESSEEMTKRLGLLYSCIAKIINSWRITVFVLYFCEYVVTSFQNNYIFLSTRRAERSCIEATYIPSIVFYCFQPARKMLI